MVDDADEEELWHFRRTCSNCGYVWGGLHCPHEGYQNPCPQCETFPEVVREPPDGCACEFDF